MSNLQLRIISAVVLAAVVLVLTWIGGAAFRLLAAAIAAAMFFEWASMSRPVAAPRARIVGGVLLAIALLALVIGYSATVVWAVLLAALAASFVLSRSGGEAGWTPAGVAYAGLAGISLAMLRGEGDAGLTAIVFLFAVVWATDILAYFVGRAVGGPKLAPTVSPGKTRSGALGGAVGGVVAGVLVALFTGVGSVAALALVALALSVVSQVGDLFESWVKRRHGVKDSGWIIPGHGGVMDRVDGLVVAALALYLIGIAAGGVDNPAKALFGN